MSAPDRFGPPPLNLQPAGLLDFLGIKNGGRYPQHLSTDLVPTLELLRWYVAANSIEIGSVSPAFQLVANEGTTTHLIAATQPVNFSVGGTLMVPQTEYWYIDRWSVNWFINAQAGASIRVVPVTTPAGGAPSIRVPCTFGGFETSDPAINRAGHASMIDPIILRPGTVLSLLNEGAIMGAAGVNVNMQMRFCRFLA